MNRIKTPGIIKAFKKVKGGVEPGHFKNTAEMEVEVISPVKKVTIAMQQHIGAPCTPCVKVGDTVDVGQLIGTSDKFVSAPIHASISGKVTAIGNMSLPNGAIVQGVTIESDGEMRVSPDIKPVDPKNKQEFLDAVRNSGLVGLGGAGFPTHVKLNVPADKHIDTLIVNAAECEPFITVDYRECVENSWDILSGINIIKDFLEIENVIITIENNKPEAFRILKEIADTDNMQGDHIRIMSLEAKYPQGAEKVLIRSATGREVPPGKLPADVGCIVMNVTSTAFVSRYFKTGMPLISRNITVDGSAVAQPKNVRVPIGTYISDIFDFCGGFKENPSKILTGGPMMGLSVVGTDLPIIKNNNAVLAFTEKECSRTRETACIRCGACASVCPMNLIPTAIERFAKAKDIDALEKAGVNVCMECGSCAYQCPAKKPLVQIMKNAKSVLKEGKSNA